jgi:hypothetical protein
VIIGQLIIHENYVGTNLRRDGDSIVDGTDDAHHIDVLATVQQAAKTLCQDLLVVDDEYTNMWSILRFARGDGGLDLLKCIRLRRPVIGLSPGCTRDRFTIEVIHVS